MTSYDHRGMLNAGLATRLDSMSAFEHLQALIANGPDLTDLDEWDDILTRVAAFCKSGTLLADVEAFCTEHAPGFDVETSQDGYPIYWTQLHEQYAARIEQQLEAFLSSQGASIESFYATCRDCLERSRAEGRWNKDAMFVQVSQRALSLHGHPVTPVHTHTHTRTHTSHTGSAQVLTASCEFEEFVALMRAAAKHLQPDVEGEEGGEHDIQ